MNFPAAPKKPYHQHNNNGTLVFHHDMSHAVNLLERTKADPTEWSATTERTMLMGNRFSKIIVLQTAEITNGKLSYLQSRVAPGGQLIDMRPKRKRLAKPRNYV